MALSQRIPSLAVMMAFAGTLGAQTLVETLEPGRIYNFKTDHKTHVFSLPPGAGIVEATATLFGTGLGLEIRHSRDGDAAVSSRGAHLDCGPIRILHDLGDAPAHYLAVLPSGYPDGDFQLRVDWLSDTERARTLLEAQSLVLPAEQSGASPPDAAARFGRALEIYRRLGDTARVAYALFGRGSWLDRAGNYREAADAFRESAARYVDAGDEVMHARALLSLGATLAADDRSKEAIQAFQQTFPIFERDPRFNGLVGESYLSLAAVHEATGNETGAEALRLAAAMKFAAARRMDRSAFTMRLVVVGMLKRGNFGAGIRNAEAGLTAARESRDIQDQVWLHVLLGEAYVRLRQPDVAERNYKQALALADGRQYDSPIARAWAGLASLYLAQNRNADADAATARSLAAAKSAGPQVEKELRYQRAVDDLGQGRNEQAIEGFRQAIAEFDDAKEWRLKAHARYMLGTAYALTNRGGTAVEELSAALPGLRAAGDRENESEALELLMLLLRGRYPGLAIALGKQAVSLRQITRRNLAVVNLDRETQLSYLNKVGSLYRSLADLLIARGRLAEAEQVIRFLKGEEYEQFISRGGAPAEAVALSPEELKWQAEYEEATKGLIEFTVEREALLSKPLTPDTVAQLKVLNAKIAPGNSKFSEFLRRMQATYKGPSNSAAVESIKSAEGLQGDIAELPEGTVAIYTLVGGDALRLVLVTPKAAVAYLSPIRSADLNRKIAAFREALRNTAADPRPLAKEMYGLLMPKDLEAALATAKATTLMWSLDGALRYLPLAALYDGNQWLIERYRLSLFNLSSRGHLKDDPVSKWRVAGFGVTKAHGDFAALPAVGQELDGIKAATQAAVLLDSDFTKDSLDNVLLTKPKAVHIASHFALRAGDVESSFLLLGDGNRLSIADLKGSLGLFQGVELLTLSACDTASGTESDADGHEFEGLARVAEDLGAKAVMATLWPVADASTGTLMRRFYERRAEGNISKSEALRQAQLDLIRSAASAPSAASSTGFRLRGQQPPPAGFSHPYHWAPFVLIGNWK